MTVTFFLLGTHPKRVNTFWMGAVQMGLGSWGGGAEATEVWYGKWLLRYF